MQGAILVLSTHHPLHRARVYRSPMIHRVLSASHHHHTATAIKSINTRQSGLYRLPFVCMRVLHEYYPA